MLILEDVATDVRLGADTKLVDKEEASEPGNAERLARIARGRIHWVDTWKTWIVYQDGRWVYDSNGVYIMRYAKAVVKHIFGLAEQVFPGEDVVETAKDKDLVKNLSKSEAFAYEWWQQHLAWAKKSNTEPMMRRMVNLARDIPGVIIHHDELDAKPYLLNVQNGTVDLLTGQFKYHDPADLLMQMAPVDYDPNAKAPLWLEALRTWQPNPDHRRYLQSVCGSAITGVPLTKLFVNVGEGQNGKSVFYGTLMEVIGSYAVTPDDSLFMDVRADTHTEEKAKLRGVRMMVANETSLNGRLNESSVKKYTGKDTINARHLYGKPFSFKPTHTAFLHTNHWPKITGTDIGIWRRVQPILWEVTIKAADIDTELGDKLLAERSGILNWLIEGVHMFRKDLSLTNIPVLWQRAHAEYRESEDQIGRFLKDVFEGGFDVLKASQLRTKYVDWCEAEGVRPWSAQAVGRELTKRGYNSVVIREGQTTVKCWRYEGLAENIGNIGNTVTDVTDNEERSVTQKSASDQDLSSSVTDVTFFSPIKCMGEKEEEKDIRERDELTLKAVTIGNTVTMDDPGPDYWAEQERAWLEDHGFVVTYREPSEDEIERYLAGEWD